MDHEKARAEETAAMERVLTATKRVQAAFASLQTQFPPAAAALRDIVSMVGITSLPRGTSQTLLDLPILRFWATRSGGIRKICWSPRRPPATSSGIYIFARMRASLF